MRRRARPRGWWEAAHQQPDARRILTDYARAVYEVSARIAPLNAVVQAAAGLDADIRALAEEGRQERLARMRFLAQLLADRGALKPSLTVPEAADTLWLFNDPAVYHRLVIEQLVARTVRTMAGRSPYQPARPHRLPAIAATPGFTVNACEYG